MEKHLTLSLSPKQGEAFLCIEDPAVRELLFGGGKGGGKSVFGCKWVFWYVKKLIQFFNLRPSDTPPVLGFIGRKQAVDFSTTTLNTWKRDIPADAFEIKEQKKLIVIERCAAIQFGGLDDTDTVQKFNSAEYVFVWLDQPDECTQRDVGMLRATLRLKINGKEPKYKFLLTPNPVVSDDPDLQWLKNEFIDADFPHRRFVKALFSDNPFLPDNYGETLKDALSFNPALLKAYRDGDWDQMGVANVVIPKSIVLQNVNNPYPWVDQFERRITVSDIASSGEDETVIYNMVNSKIVSQEIYKHVGLMDTCGRIQAHAKANMSTLISVDKIGEGSGVWARLCEIYDKDGTMKVHGFDSRVSAPEGTDDETYGNYRAYAWFKASKKYFVENRANIHNDPILISQLAGVKFKFKSNGKIFIESKDDIKKRTGKSPDRADTYIMGLDAIEQAQPLQLGIGMKQKSWMHHRYQVDPRLKNPYEGRALPEKEWQKLQARQAF